MPNEWQTVLDEIKSHLSDMAYGTYFTNLKFISNTDGHLVLSVPSIFVKTSIENKYFQVLKDAIAAAGIEYEDLNIILSDKFIIIHFI